MREEVLHLARLKQCAVVVTLTAFLLIAGNSFGQTGPTWSLADADERFAGRHAAIQVEPATGTQAGVLQVGCDAENPSFPRVVLTAERDLGDGVRELYLRVVGLYESSTHAGKADGANLQVDGFGAVVLLTEVLAPASARALFLRLEGPDGGAWSVPLLGFRDAVAGLPCVGALD